jgi:hypothetical protein
MMLPHVLLFVGFAAALGGFYWQFNIAKYLNLVCSLKPLRF